MKDMPRAESPIAFKVRANAAMDWSHERNTPIHIDRDKDGFWFVEALLQDTHGTFRAVVSLTHGGDMRELLDEAVGIAEFERRKAFRGKTPGHLSVRS